MSNFFSAKFFKQTVSLSIVLVGIYGCTTVPITGRRQLSLVPESEVVAMGVSNYGTFLKDAKLSTDGRQTANDKKVGKNISIAVESFMKQNGMADRISSFQWEFNLVTDPTVNAWCMPGGKVVFYSGIMAVCGDENGVAVVMGHEIAHAVARHGSERMSQEMGVQLGGATLQMALANKSAETQSIFMAAYGVGSQVGILLPYSRSHESEADKLGLIFIAMAGYNPRSAVDFWKRMAAQGGAKPPQILSTHPADSKRIADLEAYLPEAMKYYNK